jgi:hypothetical protein
VKREKGDGGKWKDWRSNGKRRSGEDKKKSAKGAKGTDSS